jgi:hypothetical protein
MSELASRRTWDNEELAFEACKYYVSLLYGAYAAWNWAIADEIAADYGWRKLLPDHDPLRRLKAGWQTPLVRGLAGPCQGSIAPVFWMFFVISMISAAIHTALLCRAL